MANSLVSMSDIDTDSIFGISGLPPLTIGNLTLALLGLTLVVILLGITNTDLNTFARIAILSTSQSNSNEIAAI